MLKRGVNDVRCTTPVKIDAVLHRRNIDRAIRRVVLKKGSPGGDGLTTKQLRSTWCKKREQTIESIQAGVYEPAPTRRVKIPKGGGNFRTLTIPSVFDRMLQNAVLRPLISLIDPSFHEHSFGFRPGRNVQLAIKSAQKFISTGSRIVVSLDIEKCFDRLKHDLMLNAFDPLVDTKVLQLIKSWLESGMSVGMEDLATTAGVMQGGPLSPIACNLYLHRLDLHLEREGFKFIRYADDVNLFCKDEREANRALQTCSAFMEGTLFLPVNDEKTKIADHSEIDILGVRIRSDLKIEIAPGRQSRMKDRITHQVTRKRLRPEKMVETINSSIEGWNAYYKKVLIPLQYSIEIATHSLKLIREYHPRWVEKKIEISMWEELEAMLVTDDGRGLKSALNPIKNAINQVGLKLLQHDVDLPDV